MFLKEQQLAPLLGSNPLTPVISICMSVASVDWCSISTNTSVVSVATPLLFSPAEEAKKITMVVIYLESFKLTFNRDPNATITAWCRYIFLIPCQSVAASANGLMSKLLCAKSNVRSSHAKFYYQQLSRILEAIMTSHTTAINHRSPVSDATLPPFAPLSRHKVAPRCNDVR